MDRFQTRNAFAAWLSTQGYTHTATLAINEYGISPHQARKHLRNLHARLDRLVLGQAWAKKSADVRLQSISFIEHPTSNLHFHMLWKMERFADKVATAMPNAWETLVPSGDAKVRPITENDGIYRYCVKALADDSFILSAEFCSATSTQPV